MKASASREAIRARAALVAGTMLSGLAWQLPEFAQARAQPEGKRDGNQTRGHSATGMTHIAIQESLDGKAVEWMEHVSDEEYGS
jgi:hypothetical protein